MKPPDPGNKPPPQSYPQPNHRPDAPYTGGQLEVEREGIGSGSQGVIGGGLDPVGGFLKEKAEGLYDWLTPDAKQIAPAGYDPDLNKERMAERGQAGYARMQQQDLVRMLQDQAAGKGPSMAQGQLAQGRNEAMAGAQALQASARGGNVALANRSAQQAQAQTMQGAAGQAAQLRAQEMLEARGQLGEQLGGMRGQDIGQQGLTQQQMQALLQAQTQGNVANLQSASATQGGILGAGGAILGGLFSDVTAKTGRKPLNETELDRLTEELRQKRVVKSGGESKGWQAVGEGIGKGIGTRSAGYASGAGPYGGSWGAEQQQPTPEPLGFDVKFDPASGIYREPRASGGAAPSQVAARADWYKPIESERYQYKPEFGGGEYVGPNAQALERSPDPAVQNLVKTDAATGKKAIDGGRAGVMSLGLAADQQRQIKELHRQIAEMKGSGKGNFKGSERFYNAETDTWESGGAEG